MYFEEKFPQKLKPVRAQVEFHRDQGFEYSKRCQQDSVDHNLVVAYQKIRGGMAYYDRERIDSVTSRKLVM